MDELRARIPPEVRQQRIIEYVDECRQIARDGGDINDLDNIRHHLGAILQYGRDLISEPEPGTGNTLLHIAAQNAQFAVIKYIRGKVSAKCGNGYRRFSARRYALLCKRNNEGNTALHLAVTNPNLDVTRSMYSFFGNLWIPSGYDSDSDREERSPDKPLIPDPDGVHESRIKHMMTALFVKNNAGRDVISEARFAGQTANAEWCEKALKAMDPNGEWQSPEIITRMTEELWADYKRYLPELNWSQ